MSNKTIEDLRQALFAELDLVQSGKGDRDRVRMVVALSEQLIDSARVEVQLNVVLRGALDVPFIENQAGERPSSGSAPAPAKPVSPTERMANLLGGGPPESHPWRQRITRRSK